MPKRTTPPNKKLPTPSNTPTGAADKAQTYRDDPNARFAPYDNLWDAIRADVAEFGSGFDIKPPKRYRHRSPPEARIAINAIIDYNQGMASITIRNLTDDTKKRLRLRAAEHGRSLEAEAREILNNGVASQPAGADNLFDSIHRRFAALGGVELKLPKRGSRKVPKFR